MRRRLAVAASVGMLIACGPRPQDFSMRQGTQSYRYEISADSLPPYANELVSYTITVVDRKTEQPIQNGEGQIYGQFAAGARPYTWDSFVYGPEVGTYHAKLRFALGGPYAMGLRFRRDSLAPLEKTDWQQQVLPERDIKPPS
jgi:hypothetical protein